MAGVVKGMEAAMRSMDLGKVSFVITSTTDNQKQDMQLLMNLYFANNSVVKK